MLTLFQPIFLYIPMLIVTLQDSKKTKTQSMNLSDFFRKFKSRYLIGNLCAMMAVVVVVFSMLSLSYGFRHAAETGRAGMARFRGLG